MAFGPGPSQLRSRESVLSNLPFDGWCDVNTWKWLYAAARLQLLPFFGIAADAAFLRDSQVPIALSAFATKLTNAAWRTKPSWAVIATQDKAFDQRMLRTMAERIDATVTEVEASHAVFMTQPKIVADTIDKAAQGATLAVR